MLKHSLNSVRLNAALTNSVRNFADKCSVDKSNINQKKSTTKKSTDESIKKAKVAEKLETPGKPSDKYEANQYFGYNEYSFNDLLSEMVSRRNPQPKAK